jgi:hypothetical protein
MSDIPLVVLEDLLVPEERSKIRSESPFRSSLRDLK